MDNAPVNIESVKARLKNIAKESHRDFDAVLLQFFQERFLYRLSISMFRDTFILKGGLLLLVQNMSRFRPTKDVDLLGVKVKNDIEYVKTILVQVLAVDCNDSIEYHHETMAVSKIREDADYEGIRVKVDAAFGNIRKKLTIDIGFGDTIIPEAREFSFPVLLGMPAPELKCYSFESVIAEKFQAIVWLNYLTSRMKDFYDIYYLSQNYTFESEILKKAIEVTFYNRATQLENYKIIFDSKYRNEKEKHIQWNAFILKNKIHAPSFPEVTAALEKFISPLFMFKPGDGNYFWSPKRMQWKTM